MNYTLLYLIVFIIAPNWLCYKDYEKCNNAKYLYIIRRSFISGKIVSSFKAGDLEMKKMVVMWALSWLYGHPTKESHIIITTRWNDSIILFQKQSQQQMTYHTYSWWALLPCEDSWSYWHSLVIIMSRSL